MLHKQTYKFPIHGFPIYYYFIFSITFNHVFKSKGAQELYYKLPIKEYILYFFVAFESSKGFNRVSELFQRKELFEQVGYKNKSTQSIFLLKVVKCLRSTQGPELFRLKGCRARTNKREQKIDWQLLIFYERGLKVVNVNLMWAFNWH